MLGSSSTPMKTILKKMLAGYKVFRKKYVNGDVSVMHYLSTHGQQPQVMVIACCDSRVDPALILQCDPGDLFVLRNVANIVPPFEEDDSRHGTSAALEFGVRVLRVQHLIILGHSQCGGIQALLNHDPSLQFDFVDNWVSIIKVPQKPVDNDDFAKEALKQSKDNCLTFPWLKQRIDEQTLEIHLWFFDVRSGRILSYNKQHDKYEAL